jgi:hypothetical protein
LENLTTGAAAEVKNDSATLSGSYTGDGQDVHYYFEYGTDTDYGQSTSPPPGDDNGTGAGAQNVAPITITGLKAATTYHYRLVASNTYGTTYGQDETTTTVAAVANLSTDPASGVDNLGADLNGSYDADKYDVHYYFEYGPTTAYGTTVPVPPGNLVPGGSGHTTVPSVHISNLQQGATYHYRIIAGNTTGTSIGPDVTLQTADGPEIGNLSTANVTATSATLKGEINPEGGATSYHFDWGRTTAYGISIPVPDADIGSGLVPVPVSAQLAELESGVTYHFRLVAENQFGKDTSPDQSFGFYPPACPNAQVRQETGSSHAPDCRGYELASPAFANGTLLLPWAPTSPYATNPSHVAFSGEFGAVPGTGEPTNVTSDLYVATRTDTGWNTKYIGLPPSEAPTMGAPAVNVGGGAGQLGTQASHSMDRIVNYNPGYRLPQEGALRIPFSNAPYVWNTSTGALVKRLPTNLASIPGGEAFVGVPAMSADFSHLVFSSNVVFAPGGEASVAPSASDPCCSASIYDNDVNTGEVNLASLKKDNTPFRGSVLNISEDGSHILMIENGIGGPTTPQQGLYLRVDHDRTYEIAMGHEINYVASTADGATVYLTSTEKLTTDDTDTSSDLFVWRESTPGSLTRVSAGRAGDAGNIDSCSVPWAPKCGVWTIVLKGSGGTGMFGNGHSDSPIALDSGDIYFESPEQLDGAKGEFGQVNLYVYRNNDVQYVTTLKENPYCINTGIDNGCSINPVARMQVTRNGSRAAFVTVSKLTSYENADHGEMYTFSPESGRINCVSCRTDGQPPTDFIFASQNGLFLTEDGRTFFSTREPLVPRDTNEGEDVYEYTEGRPQLLSAGIGPVNTVLGAFSIKTRPGLIGVSANGTDAFFSTSDNLVTQDHNGPELKIYDARTGGGFPAEASVLRCEAADECHGPTSDPPAQPSDRTSANLGKPAKRHITHKKKRHRKHTKRKTKAKKRQNRAAQGGHHRG